MTNGSDKSFPDVATLFEAVLGDAEARPMKPAPLDAIVAAAELSALMEAEPDPGIGAPVPDGKLAAYLDVGLDDGEKRELEATLAASPVDLHDVVAMIGYLDDLAAERSPVPASLLEAAIADLNAHQNVAAQRADIIPLRGRSARGEQFSAAPLTESFQLLAAASDTGNQAIVCRSQSGIWTLEVFVGQSEPDQVSERGYLLLSVHPDHRATYEGRTARIFVNAGNEERVLVEETVRDGEVYAEILLTGLDLRTKDAVNVVFGPAPT